MLLSKFTVLDFLCLYFQEIQIKVAGLTFILMQLKLGVSELNTLVLQNNCLLYSWIFKGFFMSHFAELQSVVYQKFIKLMIPPNIL